MNGLNSNPLGQNMNPMEQQLSQMLNQVKGMGNPQQVIQLLCQRNPKFAQYLQTVQNPQKAVRQIMSQRGINIDNVLKNI